MDEIIGVVASEAVHDVAAALAPEAVIAFIAVDILREFVAEEVDRCGAEIVVGGQHLDMLAGGHPPADACEDPVEALARRLAHLVGGVSDQIAVVAPEAGHDVAAAAAGEDVGAGIAVNILGERVAGEVERTGAEIVGRGEHLDALTRRQGVAEGRTRPVEALAGNLGELVAGAVDPVIVVASETDHDPVGGAAAVERLRGCRSEINDVAVHVPIGKLDIAGRSRPGDEAALAPIVDAPAFGRSGRAADAGHRIDRDFGADPMPADVEELGDAAPVAGDEEEILVDRDHVREGLVALGDGVDHEFGHAQRSIGIVDPGEHAGVVAVAELPASRKGDDETAVGKAGDAGQPAFERDEASDRLAVLVEPLKGHIARALPAAHRDEASVRKRFDTHRLAVGPGRDGEDRSHRVQLGIENLAGDINSVADDREEIARRQLYQPFNKPDRIRRLDPGRASGQGAVAAVAMHDRLVGVVVEGEDGEAPVLQPDGIEERPVAWDDKLGADRIPVRVEHLEALVRPGPAHQHVAAPGRDHALIDLASGGDVVDDLLADLHERVGHCDSSR